MTIAVCIWVPEGIVLASESRQVYKNEKQNYRIASEFGQKVFQLSAGVGGITYGKAYISRKNIHSLTEEFKTTSKASGKDLDKASVGELAQLVGEFLQNKLNDEMKSGSEQTAQPTSLILGGYEKEINKIFEVSLPGPSIIEISTSAKFWAVWRGQTDVITRLLKGYDPRIGRLSWFQPSNSNELEKLSYIINFDTMTLQDAIDFAIFLIKTTIDMQRFSDGIMLDPGDIPGTGGPIDIAVIRPNKCFKWVQRKELRGETVSKLRQTRERFEILAPVQSKQG